MDVQRLIESYEFAARLYGRDSEAAKLLAEMIREAIS